MLIVSQDGEEVINYDRITEIVLNNNEIVITDNIYKDYGETIGEYATKERAKGVLEEIIEAITDYKIYRMPKK